MALLQLVNPAHDGLTWLQQSATVQAAPEQRRSDNEVSLFNAVEELNAMQAALSKAESTLAVLPVLHVKAAHTTALKISPLQVAVSVLDAAVPAT